MQIEESPAFLGSFFLLLFSVFSVSLCLWGSIHLWFNSSGHQP
jgi:hypothetical protein